MREVTHKYSTSFILIPVLTLLLHRLIVGSPYFKLVHRYLECKTFTYSSIFTKNGGFAIFSTL